MGHGVRSCLEFISENIQGIFPGILFHLLRSIASYVTKKMGQKGGNRPLNKPEIEMGKIRQNGTLKQSLNKFKTAS